jgi:hypothetical protein
VDLRKTKKKNERPLLTHITIIVNLNYSRVLVNLLIVHPVDNDE